MQSKQSIALYIASCVGLYVSRFVTADLCSITGIPGNFFAENCVFDCASAVVVRREWLDVPI